MLIQTLVLLILIILLIPNDSLLLVSDDHVTAQSLGMGPDLLPDLDPPGLPGVALVPVVQLLQQLDGLGADHPAKVDQESGRKLCNGQEWKLWHILFIQTPHISSSMFVRTGTTNTCA